MSNPTQHEAAPDERPAQCRFRLQDEGKPYPRSSCTAYGKTITTGLGTHCTATHAPTKQAPATPPVADARRVEKADEWVMVPRKATAEMLAAFWRQKNTGAQTPGDTGPKRDDFAAYRSLIAAAPPAPPVADARRVEAAAKAMAEHDGYTWAGMVDCPYDRDSDDAPLSRRYWLDLASAALKGDSNGQ